MEEKEASNWKIGRGRGFMLESGRKRGLRLDSGVSERPQVEEWGDGKASGERVD